MEEIAVCTVVTYAAQFSDAVCSALLQRAAATGGAYESDKMTAHVGFVRVMHGVAPTVVKNLACAITGNQ